MDRPNIVIVIPEMWRGDLVGCIKESLVSTPNLDRLTEEGMYFSNAFTTNPICGPSRCSLFTGWFPHTRGHRSQTYLLEATEPNIFRYMKEQGYKVGFFGKNDALSIEALRESVHMCQEGTTGPTYMTRSFDSNLPYYERFALGKWDGIPQDHKDNAAFAQAIDFIDEVKDNHPYFIVIAMNFVHDPYFVEEPWYSMYEGKDVGHIVPLGLKDKPRFHQLVAEYFGTTYSDDSWIQKQRNLYRGMISRSDHLIGKFVDELKSKDLWEDSAFMMVSDHGNYCGDYRNPIKWWTGMEDSLLRVPMYVKLPNQKIYGESKAMVQHLDLFATCLELADVEATWNHFSHSLVSLLNGAKTDHREVVLAVGGGIYPNEKALDLDRAMFRNFSNCDASIYPWVELLKDHPESTCITYCIRTNQYKYIHREDDVCEFYDLENDPYEELNLFYLKEQAYDNIIHNLQMKLLTSIICTNDVFPYIEEDLIGLPSLRNNE